MYNSLFPGANMSFMNNDRANRQFYPGSGPVSPAAFVGMEDPRVGMFQNDDRAALMQRLRQLYGGQQPAMSNQPVAQPQPVQPQPAQPQPVQQQPVQASGYQIPNMLGFANMRSGSAPMRYSSYMR
jgi:hypothetical protein